MTTTVAEELRRRELERYILEMEWEEQIRTRQAEKHFKLVEDVFRQHLGEAERMTIRQLITGAAANGRCEAMVYSFPARCCTDGGRAIEKNLPHWQKTLQGNAKELYHVFTETAKPQRYGLRAAVVDFAEGFPAEIGFFVTWEPLFFRSDESIY
ncbi:hypothetical protein PY650_26945 [Rhizobium calliandrae]|uniref:Uncharacterized protein n=1 Tax=Rhizobium calliandrae TaxID=1312182 RepID=A0ABT7KKW9_9HYPH|nr:hypothetical protein [Rhizobium calliandrae]MDL2409207.1 hypothetical protein [Rhizobium calliandrae]